MGLNDYSGEGSEGGPKKSTYYKFENPSHPESKEFAEPDQAQEHYDAARFIQSQLGNDRHGLVGTFLVAVRELEQNDNEEPLKQLFSQLRE